MHIGYSRQSKNANKLYADGALPEAELDPEEQEIVAVGSVLRGVVARK